MASPHNRKKLCLSPGDAETIALQAVEFLAADGDRLANLMAETGLSQQDFTARSGDLALLAGVLDYLLGYEALLLEFAASADLQPEVVLAARRSLPGGFDAA